MLEFFWSWGRLHEHFFQVFNLVLLGCQECITLRFLSRYVLRLFLQKMSFDFHEVPYGFRSEAHNRGIKSSCEILHIFINHLWLVIIWVSYLMSSMIFTWIHHMVIGGIHISHTFVSVHIHLRFQLPEVFSSVGYVSVGVFLKRRAIYFFSFIEVSVWTAVEIFSADSEGVHLNLNLI